MPVLVKQAHEVGLKGTKKVAWTACEACGVERWVFLRAGKPQSRWCHPCSHSRRRPTGRSGPLNARWKGGRSTTTLGYVEVWLSPESEFAAMASDNYILEHRLAMAQHLGRCLLSEEEVHHRDRNKTNNAIENLELLSKAEHAARHLADVTLLEARVADLERQLRECSCRS